MGPLRSGIFRLLFFVLVLLTWGCDHATKSAAVSSLAGNAAVPVVRGLELRYVENTDIAFSVLRTLGIPQSPAFLAAISAVATSVLVFSVLRRGAEPRPRLTCAGLALVLGGAAGNLVDRIVRGYVVDFIHVSGWPIFNVADIAVVVGMGLIALAHVRQRPRPAT